MSFSSEVKKELCQLDTERRHCQISEIAAIINACGHIRQKALEVGTESYDMARKYFTLIQKTFNINCNVSIKKSSQVKMIRNYSVQIKNPVDMEKVLGATRLLRRDDQSQMIDKNINPLVVKSDCCKRAYIRGAFIASGSMSDPQKAYHMEFVYADVRLSENVRELINFFGLHAKIVNRKGYHIVYLKEGENIVDMLNIMEAHRTLMRMENVRIVKDVRNRINRKVNCEAANISKTVRAAVRQIEDIEYISNTKGLGWLSESLEEVARLRLMYDEATLSEIGAMLTPPVGKSGVNHRLRKICEIAEQLRRD